MISLSSTDYTSYRSLASYSPVGHAAVSPDAEASESLEKSLHSSSRFESITHQESLSTRVQVRLTKAELYENVAQKQPENPYAATILSGISSQLSIDSSQGASQAELQSRWQAGLDGFLQGFNDARDQLQAIGALDPSVAAAINDTYNRVLSGLEEQAEEYGLDSKALEQYRDQETIKSEAPINTNQIDTLGRGLIGRHVETLATQRDFSFQLRTNDGDLVMIEVAAAQAKAAAYERNEQGSGLAYVSQSSSSFNFSVKGELDDEELTAINDLLSQVNEISDTFFNGDVQDAFNLALEIGYDSSEISSFAVALSKTSVQQTSTYAPNAYSGVTEPSLSEKLSPVSEFAGLVDESLHTAAKLRLDQLLVAELTEQFTHAKYGDNQGANSIKSFVEQFLPAPQ